MNRNVSELLKIFGYQFLGQVVTFPEKPVTDYEATARGDVFGYRFHVRGYRFLGKPVTKIMVCFSSVGR
jgi:hypothetical protein